MARNHQMNTILAWVLALGIAVILGNGLAFLAAYVVDIMGLGAFPEWVGFLIVIATAMVTIRTLENVVRNWGYDLPDRETGTGLRTDSNGVDDAVSDRAAEALTKNAGLTQDDRKPD